MHGTQQNDITRHAGFAQGVVIIRRQETNSAYIRLFQQGQYKGIRGLIKDGLKFVRG